ncbi:MAG TPA: outer membrane protein assembly factor [Bacteroides sp.]|nr:outer membrane protein assembly factor [Bacteroides sp.]
MEGFLCLKLSIFAPKIQIIQTHLSTHRSHRAHSLILVLAGLLILLASSCKPTKYVGEDEFLLDKYKLKVEEDRVDQKELNTYIKPKPNKNILGVKFYLGLYNLSGKKDNGFNRWLRKIGEPPVLYDRFETERNNKQINLYMRNKGYYDAVISDTVKTRKKQAQVTYNILPGQPYTIRSVAYFLEDTSIQSIFLPDTVNTLVKRGDNFDVDVMQNERLRIETLLRDRGYLNFNREYVHYQVDSSLGTHQVDLTLGVKKYIITSEDGYLLQVPHRKYKVEEVFIYPGFDPNSAISDYQSYIEGLTREEFNNFTFLHEGKMKANPNVVSQSVFILPGELYNAEKVKQSYQHLSSLRIYKVVNITFEEKDSDDQVRRDHYPVVCHIQLSPTTNQSYTVELEGTNSGGNIGGGANFNYMHRNLFGGAENFSARFSGGIERLRQSDQQGFGNMIELGTEARLTLPQFLLPFKTEDFIRKYNPKTNISASYNYQKRPEYTRSIMQTTFGYNWSGNELVTHIVNPVQFNYVDMINATEAFIDSIRGTYLQHSYEDRLILAANYGLIFSNQKLKKNSDFLYFRSNLESAGFLLSGLARVTNAPKDSLDRYLMFGNAFAQYIKGDVEFRWYNIFNDKTSLVYRLFLGIAYPYGNTIAIPFEKQYYSGGANGVRAWHVRDLGPGTYSGTGLTKYPNKTADVKIEANIEYRFKLFWVLEGSLFVDAGNIWSVYPDSEQVGANFSWDTFYKQFAVGPGLGLRMDFSFFVLRTDFGFQFRDPSSPEGKRWVIVHEPLRAPIFNLAIGYPF